MRTDRDLIFAARFEDALVEQVDDPRKVALEDCGALLEPLVRREVGRLPAEQCVSQVRVQAG